MGLYVGTNGVGVTARVRSGLSRNAKSLIVLGFLVFIAVSLAIKYWHVTLPIAVFVLLLLAISRPKRSHPVDRPVSQASVSNRR